MRLPFAKGHGTGNDFVVLPDSDGTLHDELTPDLVRLLCDRRTGIGADGVLRVVRGDEDGGAAWFMDHRNADGSVSEMCGNGLRVFARYLATAGLVEPGRPLDVDTRDGVKQVRFCPDGEISVDMGCPTTGGAARVSVGDRTYDAVAVRAGNPHAVVFVDSLDEPGELADAPVLNPTEFPEGANVEFVVRVAPTALAMRVHERGVGETRSCGTGACAAAVAAQLPADVGAGTPYQVDVPGGRLTVTWEESGQVQLKGPAVLVAEGVWLG